MTKPNILLKTEVYDRFERPALVFSRTQGGVLVSAQVADHELDREALGHLLASLGEMYEDLPLSEEELAGAEILGVCECCDCSDERDCEEASTEDGAGYLPHSLLDEGPDL